MTSLAATISSDCSTTRMPRSDAAGAGDAQRATGAKVDPDLARILATFDAAYDSTWPAKPGEFWADRYPPGAAPYANLVHARNRRVAALVGEGDALLDVGSGYGDLLYLLRERFVMLRGVDPSNKSCAMATYNLASRAVGNDFRFVVGVAEALPFDAGAFDAVTMLDTYEHIEPAHRMRALAEARRVLRPGGRLVLVTPSRRMLKFWALIDNLLTLRGQMRMRKKHGTPVRIIGLPKKTYCEVFTTPAGLKREVRAAGFRIERFERVSFYPAPERGGYFYRFFEKLAADHPRVRRALAVVNAFERMGLLSQKMLVVALPDGSGGER